MASDDPGFLVNRHSRKIAYVLVGPSELIEQGGFATVLVADECERDFFVDYVVVFAFFACDRIHLAVPWMFVSVAEVSVIEVV